MDKPVAQPLLAAAYEEKTILMAGGSEYIGSTFTQALMSLSSTART